MKIKYFFLHKTPSKRWFRNRIYSFLRQADARGNADIINRMWHITFWATTSFSEERDSQKTLFKYSPINFHRTMPKLGKNLSEL